jgi:hypothetical protein
MHGQTDVRTGRRSYRCTRPKYQVDDPCRGVAGADQLEDVVWSAVERALRNPELIAAEVAKRHEGALAQQEGIDQDREAVERPIALCDRDLRKWEAAYLSDVIDLQDFSEKKAAITARRTACEQELARLATQQHQIDQAAIETATLAQYSVNVAKALGSLSYDEKRLALRALSITVVWQRDKPLDIHGSIPVSIAPDTPYYRPRRAHGRCRRC